MMLVPGVFIDSDSGEDFEGFATAKTVTSEATSTFGTFLPAYSKCQIRLVRQKV